MPVLGAAGTRVTSRGRRGRLLAGVVAAVLLAGAGWFFALDGWPVVTARLERALGRAHASRLVFSPDGATLASTHQRDHTVRLWRLRTGGLRRTLHVPGGQIGDIAFGPDSRLLMIPVFDRAARTAAIQVWDARTGGRRRAVPHPAPPPRPGMDGGVAFSPDGTTVASGGDDGAVRLTAIATGAAGRGWRASDGPVRVMRYSPDGTMLVTAELSKSGDGGPPVTFKVWDVASGVRRFTPTAEAHTFSPDSTTLAASEGGDPNRIALWDTRTGRLRRSTPLARDQIGAVVFSPDSRTLATGSGVYDWGTVGNARVRLIDAATGAVRRTFVVMDDAIPGDDSLAFSPDGTILTAVTEKERVRLWRVRAL